MIYRLINGSNCSLIAAAPDLALAPRRSSPPPKGIGDAHAPTDTHSELPPVIPECQAEGIQRPAVLSAGHTGS